MKTILLIIILVANTTLLARNIKEGGIRYYISSHIGWQYTDISFGESNPIRFYEPNNAGHDSLIGTTQTVDFYAGPVVTLKVGAQINAQHLQLALSTAFPELSAPSELITSTLYRFAIEYQYTFLRKKLVSPHLIAGIGFHRFSLLDGFTYQNEDKVSDVIYTGKFYQLGTGIEYHFSPFLTLTADMFYRWTQYQNVGVGSDASFPINKWGAEIATTTGVTLSF